MNTFLTDMVAVVTGSGRGIGAATALALAKAGADVVITARTEEEIQQTAERVRETGRQALAIPADVSDQAAVQQLIERTLAEMGRIDILINNAGLLPPVGDTWTIDADDWQYNIMVNLNGVFLTTHAVLPHMIERGSGRIITVTSGAAQRPTPGWSAYCTAKAGVDHFTRTVAAELDGTGVTINAAAPGVVDTEMQAEIRQFDPSQFRQVSRFQEYKREGVLRPPSEPAQMLLWLCHPATANMNGEILHLDDANVRRRISENLGVSPMSGR